MYRSEININNIDCIEFMKTKPDNHYDLAIVDPPYGIARAGQTETFTKNPKHKRKAHKDKGWDNETPTKEYFTELERVSKNQIIWGANYFVEHLTKGTMGWIVWDKGQHGLSMSDCELAYSSFNKATRVFTFNRGLIAQKGGSIHPTQKPVELYRYVLNAYAEKGDKILDTHCGSGSIAVACDNLGFDLDATEIDKEYCDNSIKRLNKFRSQISMF
jgi:site-specific DNA-methyltransferase (adenine-specific)